MTTQEKLLGGARQEYYIGVGPHVPPTGFAFYGINIRVAATTIASISEKQSPEKAAVAITNKTWEGKTDLQPNEFINFEFPVTSITLTNAGDSIWAYCLPLATY
jgi:hypothetical protein